jgi:MFS family permease
MMAGPFYIGFVTVQLGMESAEAVPTLLALQTAGSLSGALFYAWLGVRHNLLYIRLALILAATLPISALLAGLVGPFPLYIGFFTFGLAFSNLFSAYLNWIIMHATPEQRPIYTGLFNTVAAGTVLIAPLIGGTLAQAVGYEAVFVVALIMILVAFFVVMRVIHEPRAAQPVTEPPLTLEPEAEPVEPAIAR